MGNEMEKFPGTFPGTIKTPLDPRSLAKTADVIGEGEVVYVIDEGDVQYLVGTEPTQFRRKVALFHVDRLHKGTLPSSVIEVEFLEPDFPSSMESLSRGEYVLLFLKSEGTRYRLAHPTTSKLAVSRQPQPAAPGAASVLASIRETLSRSISGPNSEEVQAALDELGEAAGKEQP